MPRGVTVIILAYREPDFLNGLLENLAAQTLPPEEIIIVDDASGAEYTSRYRLPARARLLVNPQNVGIAAVSRNLALRQATGDLIAFVDQDDRWHPEKLAIQAAALAAQPEALLHYTHLQNVDEHLQPLQRQPAFGPLGRDPLAALLRHNVIAYSSVMLRRSALERVGLFDESIRAAADWDMWLRVAGAASGAAGIGPVIVGDARPLLLRRHHPRQWSKSPVMMARGAERVMAKAAVWAPQKRPDLRSLLNRRHGRWLRELGRAQLEAGEPRDVVLATLRAALRKRPLDMRVHVLLARALMAAKFLSNSAK